MIHSKITTEYEIIIGSQDLYPFKNKQFPQFNTSIKQIFPFKACQNMHAKIEQISSMNHQNLIKIFKIIQSHINQTYTIHYQYVPYQLGYQSDHIISSFNAKRYQKSLTFLLKQLLSFGIYPNIKAENFGFSNDFELKMFINPNYVAFDHTNCNQNNINQIANEMVNQFNRLFEKQQTLILNPHFKPKLSAVSDKMRKIKNDLHFTEKSKKEKLQFSSDHSDSLAHTGNQKIGNAQWQFDNDFHFEDFSNDRKMENKSKKKRTSSFQNQDRNKQQNKQKKSSWGQQRTSTVQSDQATVLKKRIEQALQKTQRTLKKYEKIKRKSPVKVHHSSIIQSRYE